MNLTFAADRSHYSIGAIAAAKTGTYNSGTSVYSHMKHETLVDMRCCPTDMALFIIVAV
jgi:hypothetical protein